MVDRTHHHGGASHDGDREHDDDGRRRRPSFISPIELHAGHDPVQDGPIQVIVAGRIAQPGNQLLTLIVVIEPARRYSVSGCSTSISNASRSLAWARLTSSSGAPSLVTSSRHR
jgi:hypothetical protein